MLRATELCLVAHPIGGFHEEETKKILIIPKEYTLIAFVVIEKHVKEISPLLTNKQGYA